MDTLSYILGFETAQRKGTSQVVIESDSYTFTDPNGDGNIEITEV